MNRQRNDTDWKIKKQHEKRWISELAAIWTLFDFVYFTSVLLIVKQKRREKKANDKRDIYTYIKIKMKNAQ